ncbi:MAG: sulfurtransferase [Caldilineaceae bacterium]|nr:sulfurtransferase [Caldilineaceae bacterium]
MSYTTIISTADLADHLDDPQWAVVDCRFSLQEPELGRRAYEEAHIPGAVYAHLNEDLSGPIEPGKTSRHPLPEVAAFVETVSGWGIDAETQVVVYDDWGGAIAARLWWMLRWLGHEHVAVLDGGWPAWTGEDRPSRGGVESRPRAEFVARPRPELLADAEEVARNIESGEFLLVDARAPERYYGMNETHDPIAGHIPRARNYFYAQNLHEGRFLPAEELKRLYGPLIGARPSQQVVFYCGSGVTATHNALAMLYAGMGESRIYPGSWSEWITDNTRPIATQEDDPA